MYVQKVEQYRPIRQVLLGLESRTRVVEAPTEEQALWDPKRIIAIAPGICLEITLDPNDSEAVPKFLFLGPENKIIHLIKGCP